MENSLKQKALEESLRVEEKPLYQGKFFSLKRETVHFKTHPPHNWDFLIHPGAVAVLPVLDNGHILLIKQWRRAVKQILIEIVAGLLDPGEKPAAAALREMQEEAGYSAKTLLPLSQFYVAPGLSTEYIHLFLAKDLVKNPLPPDDHEAIDVMEVPLSKALSMIHSGEIKDAKTICALLLYHQMESHR